MAYKKKEYYVQCQLSFDDGIEFAWIPTSFKGKEVEVGMDVRIEGTDRWAIVNAMYGTRPASEVKSHERDHMSQRKASDI